MATPRSSPIGASVASRSANRRSTLKVPIRLTLMMRTNFASGYTPSLPTVRCEPPMPAQFISTRAMPCAASAFAIAALIASSSVTSAWRATPFTSAATFSAFSLFWSMTPIFAPLAAMARAVAAPRPEPPPVMRTATSCHCILQTLPWAFLLWTRTSRTWDFEPGRLSGGCTVRAGVEQATENQRFHVPDVVAADLIGHGTDAGRARHRVPTEEQMIAGADQAGVEEHRIGAAELA